MNKCKFILFLFFVVFGTLSTFAQSWESIKSDTAYLYGEGFGVTVAEADQYALNDLIGKISLQVSSNTNSEMQESLVNGDLESRESFGMLINTYSQATLSNTEKLVIKNDFAIGDCVVGRYIKRSEIDRIFASRKAKIQSMVEAALRAESKGKIDDALRNFYWALILTKSLQYPNDASFVDDNGESHLLMTWIPEMMGDIFDEINVKTIKKDKGDVELSFLYKDVPVNSLDYTYFDGQDWTSIYSAKDGLGTLEMPSTDRRDTYQLRLEYEYRGQVHLDNDMENVIGLVKGIPMRGAHINVDAKVVNLPSEPVVENKVIQATQVTQVSTNNFDIAESLNSLEDIATTFRNNSFSTVPDEIYKMPEEVENPMEYEKILTKVIAAIKIGSKEAVVDYFTEDGIDIYERLLLYGKAKIMGEPNFSFCRLGEDVVARGLTMSFSFKTGTRKAFVQDVVFTFNVENKISNIAFGLGKTANDDILGKSVWPESVRLAIVQFLENYQTAYALKRLDYIESVFDDDAVIITGSLVPRKTQISDGMGYSLKNNVKYKEYHKSDYLAYLKRSFASKEFINIRFADTEVRKAGVGGEIFGIQLFQEYYSSNYGDRGYLFLMVDLNNPETPIIKVRTWQPEEDTENGIFGIEDFY